jgi:hypothetical protein
MNKKWWQSKTVLFNLIGGAAAVADALAGSGVLGPQALVAVNVVNIALRAVTTKPIR